MTWLRLTLTLSESITVSSFWNSLKGVKSFSGTLIQDFAHPQSYDFDISGERLTGTKVGAKYYCITSEKEKDMKKRIVHVYDHKDPTNRKKMQFYRLTHTNGKPGMYDNQYQSAEEITGWEDAVQKRIATQRAEKEFQKEANRLGWIEVPPVVTARQLRKALAHMQ